MQTSEHSRQAFLKIICLTPQYRDLTLLYQECPERGVVF